MKKSFCLLLLMLLAAVTGASVAKAGDVYRWQAELKGCVSKETGRAPVAYMWLPEGAEEVKAVMLAQQNMTEEALFRMASSAKGLLKWVLAWCG